MKQNLLTAKTYVMENKKRLLGYFAVVAVVTFFVALFIYNYEPKTSYEPANACELFTPEEAISLLGDGVIRNDTTSPNVSGDVATSKCSYTDRNENQDEMLVAAVAVRSAVNDEGIEQNKTEFKDVKSAAEATEDVEGLRQDAFFNASLGQLNVLDGRDWIIVSYGVGANQPANTIDDAVKLAKLVLAERQ